MVEVSEIPRDYDADVKHRRKKTKKKSSDAGSARRTERRPRDYRNYDDRGAPAADDEDDDGSFPMWKTALVVGVIIVCFSILYPKMFHPMLMYVLGLNRKEQEPESKRFPRPGAGAMPGRGQDPHLHSGPSPGMGMGGPHPGMRMAAEMGKQYQSQQGSGGKGMWSWMLPFYTIGVIIFLLYTLSKILFRQPKPKRPYNMRYNNRRERFELEGQNVSEDSEVVSEESEDDAGPMVQGKLGNRELKALQKRLHQTEKAMHSILGQLESISGSVDQVTAENMKKMTMETLGNLANSDARKLLLAEDENEKAKKSSRQQAEETSDYLQDLEKALSDFQTFTDNYVAEHSKKNSRTEDATAVAGTSAAPDDSAKRVSASNKQLANKAQNNEEQSEEEQESEDEEEETESEQEDEQLEEEEEDSPDDKRDSDEKENSADEEQRDRGFDAMAEENIEDLSLPEPQGEIINLGTRTQVRKRNKRRKD